MSDVFFDTMRTHHEGWRSKRRFLRWWTTNVTRARVVLRVSGELRFLASGARSNVQICKKIQKYDKQQNQFGIVCVSQIRIWSSRRNSSNSQQFRVSVYVGNEWRKTFKSFKGSQSVGESNNAPTTRITTQIVSVGDQCIEYDDRWVSALSGSQCLNLCDSRRIIQSWPWEKRFYFWVLWWRRCRNASTSSPVPWGDTGILILPIRGGCDSSKNRTDDDSFVWRNHDTLLQWPINNWSSSFGGVSCNKKIFWWLFRTVIRVGRIAGQWLVLWGNIKVEERTSIERRVWVWSIALMVQRCEWENWSVLKNETFIRETNVNVIQRKRLRE